MILARGFVPTSQGLLFKTSAPVWIQSVNYFNVNAATQTILTYLRSETLGSAQYARHVLDQNWRAKPIGAKGDFENLGIGDSIEGETTTADAVAFLVLGTYL
jgi:hypothetical protein